MGELGVSRRFAATLVAGILPRGRSRFGKAPLGIRTRGRGQGEGRGWPRGGVHLLARPGGGWAPAPVWGEEAWPGSRHVP